MLKFIGLTKLLTIHKILGSCFGVSLHKLIFIPMFLFSLTAAGVFSFINSWVFSPASVFIFMQITFIADFGIATWFAIKHKVWDSSKAPNTIDKMVWSGVLISILYWLEVVFKLEAPLLALALQYLSLTAAFLLSTIQITSFVATGARNKIFTGKFANWLINTLDTKKLSAKDEFTKRQENLNKK